MAEAKAEKKVPTTEWSKVTYTGLLPSLIISASGSRPGAVLVKGQPSKLPTSMVFSLVGSSEVTVEPWEEPKETPAK